MPAELLATRLRADGIVIRADLLEHLPADYPDSFSRNRSGALSAEVGSDPIAGRSHRSLAELDWPAPIERDQVVVLDIETTGLDSRI